MYSFIWQFRHLFFTVLLVCIHFGIVEKVYARPLPEFDISEDQKYKVAYIQQSVPIYIYKDVPVNADINTSLLRQKILSYTKNHPYLDLLSDESINLSFQAEGEPYDSFMQSEIDMGYAENLMSNLNKTLTKF